jgi:hypothetical protein
VQTVSSAPRANLLADPGFEPIDASTAIPLPEPPREMIARAQGITSCSAAAFPAAGTTAAQVNPPYTVTLTDLTPSTGQTQPNGEVGVEGIHGHRVEKVIRLRIQIKDKYGVEPTYPVLVHLATGGPAHGTLILDPGGTRKECSNASFLWHERDAQGNLVALNEEFEYRMGTWSRYVGVEPDAGSPGTVKPVWGVAEDLGIRLETPDGAPLAYNVSPEPGKPDHFLCIDFSYNECPDVFQFWTGYLSGMDVWDSYFLKDQYGNTVFGYTDTAATPPGAGMQVLFQDQTLGHTDGDYAGYTVSTRWWTSPGPVGLFGSTLTVTYPDDPDWPGGTVRRDITVQFEGGPTHVLVQKQNYEARFGFNDGPFPISVAPGSNEGSMPKTTVGDTPRLVLLALAGSQVTADIKDGWDEPSPDPQHKWTSRTGPWRYVEVQDSDLRLETQDSSQFRLSLIDGSGAVMTDGAFRVHTCPRAEHLTDPAPPAIACTDGVAETPDGTGTIEQFTLNQASAARGYMGIELTKAPRNPGTYLIKAESLGPTRYRIRRQGQLEMGRTDEAEYRGGFALCTVLGGEILDENFQRIEQLGVAAPRIVYVRYILPYEAASQTTAVLQTTDSDNATVGFVPGVQLGRLGVSSVFISGPVTVEPNQDEVPTSAGALAARAMDLPGASIRAADGAGHLYATPAACLATSVATLSGLVYDFRIGTLQDWDEPNVLFGNGQDYVLMSVRVTDATRQPLGDGWTVNAITVPDRTEGSVDPPSLHDDGDGRYSFKYTAPTLTAGRPDIVRPHFGFSFMRESIGYTVAKLQTSRPLDQRPGGCLLFGSEIGLDKQRHCFGDPNFPLVYTQYDYRRATYYSGGVEVQLTDDTYVDASMTERDFEELLARYGSKLTILYFIERTPGEFDQMQLSGVYGTDPVGWPSCYFDLDGDGGYSESSGDKLLRAARDPAPMPPVTGVRFSHILWKWCKFKGVNPKVMLTHLQKETRCYKGQVAVDVNAVYTKLTHLFEVDPKSKQYPWPSPQVAQAVTIARKWFNEGATKIPDPIADPAHGGSLFPVVAYYGQDGFDGNILFQDGGQYPVAVFVQTKSAYALFKYTTALHHPPDGSAFLTLWTQYGFEH